MMSLARHNPFATRFIRPGAVPYICPADWTLDELVQRLQESGWRGQILGGHGSGKSTLIASLVPRLRQAGRDVRRVQIKPPDYRLPPLDPRGWTSATLLVVDGYDQLAWWPRWWLSRQGRRHQAGMVVTTHRPLRMPVLARTRIRPEQANKIIEALVPNEWQRESMARLAIDLVAEHGGNMREALMDLYDWWRKEEDGRRETGKGERVKG